MLFIKLWSCTRHCFCNEPLWTYAYIQCKCHQQEFYYSHTKLFYGSLSSSGRLINRQAGRHTIIQWDKLLSSSICSPTLLNVCVKTAHNYHIYMCVQITEKNHEAGYIIFTAISSTHYIANEIIFNGPYIG